MEKFSNQDTNETSEKNLTTEESFENDEMLEDPSDTLPDHDKLDKQFEQDNPLEEKNEEVSKQEQARDNSEKYLEDDLDDNGKPYKNKEGLLPNNQYELSGYTYRTDEKGRIILAEGTLRIKDRDRLRIVPSIEQIGKGNQKEGDDRGHLIGDQFDGSNKLGNFIAQDAKINQNNFRNFENELAKDVKAGKEVKVKITPVYDGNSNRPSVIVIKSIINGVEKMDTFRNNKEE
ncbi:MAG: DNA/RNA non-specific endonuclease [Clostridia bacterium]